jgi:hypothetical protein
MNATPLPAPPEQVYKRDGQLVPFDADKISRSLFAATESLGRPDAFLARELADGVVHFLCEEGDAAPPTTEQIAELVVKVVRELGQPVLAEAYAAGRRQRKQTPVTSVAPPREVVLRFALNAPLSAVLAECAREYSLQNVFARDLVAAHRDGLVTLTGLDAPNELASCVLSPRTAPSLLTGGLAAGLADVRHFAGRCVVLDGPEHELVRSAGGDETAVREFVRELRLGMGATNLTIVVNLNSADPPSWADNSADGPLFKGQQQVPNAARLVRLADLFAEELLQTPRSLRVDWHLGETDMQPDPQSQQRLQRLARWALDGGPVAFVFDRPRCPVALAEGIDRQHPAVLLTVGLHLPRLATQTGVAGDGDRFLHKLGSLARLALSAGVQKREYLRRSDRARADRPPDAPAVTSGFLLDRARLVVAPVGLDAVAATFTGKGLRAGGEALDFGKRVVQQLREVLRQDGMPARLGTCLDGPTEFGRTGSFPDNAAEVAGLTGWDAAAPVKEQGRAAGPLHALAEGGTLALFPPEDRPATAELVAEWLRSLWKQTDVVRVRLIQ